MRPDAPRDTFVTRMRALADLIERDLPESVASGLQCRWETVSVLLRARIAGLGRSVATLLDAHCELDARMVMRSMLDHLILLAWLSIDTSELPSDDNGDAKWRARDPARNTLWWCADQLRRDQSEVGKQHALFGILNKEARAGLRAQKDLLKEPLGWGDFPLVEEMANEVDAWWGGVPGWSRAEPGEPGFVNSVRGFYWTLYKIGNGSTHPQLTALISTFLVETDGAQGTARLVLDKSGPTVDPFAGIAVFLLLYAVSVADRACGTNGLDDALRILDRFNAVRGPDLLLSGIDLLLSGQGGRRFGRVGSNPLSVERQEDTATVVRTEDGRWSRLSHTPGPRWTFDTSDGLEQIADRHKLTEVFVAKITQMRESIADARWDDPTSNQPGDWPGGAP